MSRETALVTGAAGFVGREVVKLLSEKGYNVKAAVHEQSTISDRLSLPGTTVVKIDLLNTASLVKALEGVDVLYHFAALVDSNRSWEILNKVNVEGTRNLWLSAAANSVKKALYCSSAAVYGLLASSHQPVTEEVKARAIEPYGRSKLLGEIEALKIAAQSGPCTVIIRPVAVFGPGEHTPFGRNLRDAAVSKILLAGGFQRRKFNYVHVEDAGAAAVHLMENTTPNGEVYNVAYYSPVRFEDALEIYTRLLDKTDLSFIRRRFLGLSSFLLHKIPALPGWISQNGSRHYFFNVWHPGFDLIYSSDKLRAASFQFRWDSFENVLLSCINKY
jgi:nucleoside-diphosphate-sugar epimerase